MKVLLCYLLLLHSVASIKPTMDQSTSAAGPQTTDADNDSTSKAMDSEKSRKAHFVMQHRAQLTQNVSRVMAVVDSLGDRVHPETYNEIKAEKTPQAQMRTLYTSTVVPGGPKARVAFYDALMEHHPLLLEDLGAELPSQQDSTNKGNKGAELPAQDLTKKADEETLALCKREFKSNQRQKNQRLDHWIPQHGPNPVLSDIFTEVFLTVGGNGQVNKEHEIRQIELAYSQTAGPETPVNMDDILEPLLGENEPIRVVMMKGAAGIGKSVQVQKFTQNWAEDKANLHVDFVFPFTFRELNLEMEEKNEYSMEGLLHHFFSETKKINISTFQQCNTVFIFDGLDESTPALDFPNTKKWTDPIKPTTVHILLTNLIRGNLLRKAKFWITTRPAAADQIPHVDRVTEVRGFKDPQKKEYFFKRFTDEQQAIRIYSHIETSRSVHIMCHIPAFCWITSNVMEEIVSKDEEGELPNTQTAMYFHFIEMQSARKNAKYPNRKQYDVILSLAKLAFEQLKKGNLIFKEEHLTACGIDISDAAVYSGLLGEVRGTYKEKMFSFVHLSVQEFLAALHVFITFINTGDNLLSTSKMAKSIFKSKIHHLYQSAVDQALRSQNGHLDLFLRFLLGLSLDTNQEFLQKLIRKGKRFQTNHKTIKYIKEKIRENPSPERSINLFHCLNELDDHSLEEDIQRYLMSGCLSTAKISPAQWSALVFVLLSSGKELDVFDLKKCSAKEEALLRLLPVLKASNKALLSGCNLSAGCCQELSSALSSSSTLREVDLSNNDLQDFGVNVLAWGLGSPHGMLKTLNLSGCNLSAGCCQELSSALSSKSSLRELDLCNNTLQDSGVNLLAVGLGSPHCMLETLKLSDCNLSVGCCQELSSALSSSSTLRELDLCNNTLQDSGVNLLSVGLGSPHCMLETLKLSGCNLSAGCCQELSSALSSSSTLRELDLCNNELRHYGVNLLAVGLGSPHCMLETLKLSGCNLSAGCCQELSSAISSSSTLRELDLCNNTLQDSGVNLLSVGLGSPHCMLETLKLSGCNLSVGCCQKLSSALSSSSTLRELDLCNNELRHSGVNLLAVGLGSPHCMLETLKLSGCNLSVGCCQKLSSALSSSRTLRELDLCNNELLDFGVNLLAVGLGSPHCMLETLKLSGCNLSAGCCQKLSSALSSSSTLRELDLCNNTLRDSGVNLLSVGLGSPHCMLETLNLSGCLVTEKGCSSLTSALHTNPSHLRVLNLTFNHPGKSGKAMLSAVVKDPCYSLDTLSVDHDGLRKIMLNNVCELTLDPDTAHRNLSLSENNREVTNVIVDQNYPPHEDRFEDYRQVMCKEPLSGRCYSEVQCSGHVEAAVTHREINKRGKDSLFGSNDLSWTLICDGDDKSYRVRHNKKTTVLPVSPSSYSNRVAVYLDHAAGTVSFYTVSGSDTHEHLHTYQSTFTEPLYVGFYVGSASSVSL